MPTIYFPSPNIIDSCMWRVVLDRITVFKIICIKMETIVRNSQIINLSINNILILKRIYPSFYSSVLLSLFNCTFFPYIALLMSQSQKERPQSSSTDNEGGGVGNHNSHRSYRSKRNRGRQTPPI